MPAIELPTCSVQEFDHAKTTLAAVAPELLAQALVELAQSEPAAADWVRRLTSTQEEQIAHLNNELSLLRHMDSVDWHGQKDQTRTLESLLDQIRTLQTDPAIALDLITRFYQLDKTLVETFDDSGGGVGCVFDCAAAPVFAEVAARIPDMAQVVKALVALLAEDEYGLRQKLLVGAESWLGKTACRELITELQQAASNANSDMLRRSLNRSVESLAFEVSDPTLYSKMRLDRCPARDFSLACCDIAEVNLRAGLWDAAQFWLDDVPENDPMWSYRREELQCALSFTTGDTKVLTEIAWQRFHRSRSIETLDELVQKIGESERVGVITAEIPLITERETLSLNDLAFLLDVHEARHAAEYLLKRAAQLDGYDYYTLPEIGQKLARAGYPLAATTVYRSLLDSLLERGYAKAYHHGATYLTKLGELSSLITDWQGFECHAAYRRALGIRHSRKRSFWARTLVP